MVWTSDDRFSGMGRACFWPCATEPVPEREMWISDPETMGWVVLGLAIVIAARHVSRWRGTWIALGCALSVLFSVVIMGYATSKLWRNELSYSGVGTLTAVQVLVGFVLQRTWGWVEDHVHWVMLYVAAFATLGLALGRGYVPETIDPRAAVVLETMIVVVACLVCFFVPLSSPVLGAGLTTLAVGLMWASRHEAEDGWERMGRATTRQEVGKLMQTPEFQNWMKKNHMRLRLIR